MVTIWQTKKLLPKKKTHNERWREMVVVSLSYTLEGLVVHGFRASRYERAREQLSSLGELTLAEETIIFFKAREAMRRNLNRRHYATSYAKV